MTQHLDEINFVENLDRLVGPERVEMKIEVEGQEEPQLLEIVHEFPLSHGDGCVYVRMSMMSAGEVCALLSGVRPMRIGERITITCCDADEEFE